VDDGVVDDGVVDDGVVADGVVDDGRVVVSLAASGGAVATHGAMIRDACCFECQTALLATAVRDGGSIVNGSPVFGLGS
jgi:hypothetical protein